MSLGEDTKFRGEILGLFCPAGETDRPTGFIHDLGHFTAIDMARAPVPLRMPQSQPNPTISAAEGVGGAVMWDALFLSSDCQFRGRLVNAILIEIFILAAGMVVAHWGVLMLMAGCCQCRCCRSRPTWFTFQC